MKRISAFGNSLRVFSFIKEAAKFWLYIPEERKESICDGSNSNEFNKEVDTTSELLGDPSSTRFG
jgi:hypothetical protein